MIDRMGVRGLQTFLKKNEQYLANKADLSDCSLVIDANNLLCMLYTRCASDRNGPDYRNDVYGGDLVNYGQIVREFFQNLEKCNLKAILVFDGSVIGKRALKDFVASKEKEVFRRGLDRFNRAKQLEEYSGDDDILLPQTINIVFRNTATEFGAQRIQAPYEADTHIARIANDLNCPVLTNDSDFIIYSLKKGFIMLDSFQFKKPLVDRLGKFYIECSIYSQNQLTRSMKGFNVDNMPLLSILLGNDYVEQATFDRIMQSVCNGPYHGHFVVESFSHRRIANLLTWMRGKTLNESIDFVLQLVHPANREKLERIIRIFMRNYRIETNDDFEAELEQIYPSNKVSPEQSETPVKYLKKQMERDDLGSLALDMIFRNTHYNYSIIDDFTLPSSSYVKFRPFSLALTLLRPNSYENLTIYRRKIQAERDVFYIYDRIREEYARISVKPMDTLENFGSLQHLTCYSMITLEPSLKKTILMECFRFNSGELSLMSETVSQILTGPFVCQASLCFLLVKYVGLETKLAPKPQFVTALMITLFYYAALSGNLNMQSIPDEDAYGQLLLRLRPHAISNNRKIYNNNDHSLFRRIVHFINQLQAAYKAYCLINSLLDHPCHPPRQEKFFNAVLIYRMTKLLRLSEEKIEDLCKDLPVLLEICQSVIVQVYCT